MNLQVLDRRLVIVRVGSFVVGLIGGIVGLFAAFGAMAVGGLGAAFEAEGAETVIGLGWGAVVMAIVMIVGASLVMSRKNRVGKWLLLLSTIGGFIAISAFWAFAGAFGLVATILSFLNNEDAVAHTPVR